MSLTSREKVSTLPYIDVERTESWRSRLADDGPLAWSELTSVAAHVILHGGESSSDRPPRGDVPLVDGV